MFSRNARKYGAGKTPNLDISHGLQITSFWSLCHIQHKITHQSTAFYPIIDICLLESQMAHTRMLFFENIGFAKFHKFIGKHLKPYHTDTLV